MSTPFTAHFTKEELFWLPKWNRYATKEDGLTEEYFNNLEFLCRKLDIIRDYLGKPIIIINGFRPKLYNRLVGGAPKSAHMEGKAIDWTCPSYGTCDKIRYELGPHLIFLGIRCEDLPGSNWIHIDTKGKGFFRP